MHLTKSQRLIADKDIKDRTGIPTTTLRYIRANNLPKYYMIRTKLLTRDKDSLHTYHRLKSL